MTKILPLSNLVKWVDAKNKTLVSTNLLGINIEKYFMPSVANIIGTDLSSYKVISKFQFACNPMHVGRDEKMPIALYDKEELSIVSPAYFVFEVIDSQIINPEYLMLWFKRPEFDREVWFHTDGSVRGGITWEEILEMTVPVPSIEEQIQIVNKYKSIENRISVLKQINDNLESQISALYINQRGKNSFTIDEKCHIFTGKKDVNQASNTGKYKFFSCSPDFLYSNEYIYDGKAILVAGNGSYTGRTTFVNEKFDLYQRTYSIVPNEKDNLIIYLIYGAMFTEFVKKIKESLHGSAIPYIVYNDIAKFEILYNDNIESTCKNISILVSTIIQNNSEIQSLTDLQKMILCRLSN